MAGDIVSSATYNVGVVFYATYSMGGTGSSITYNIGGIGSSATYMYEWCFLCHIHGSGIVSSATYKEGLVSYATNNVGDTGYSTTYHCGTRPSTACKITWAVSYVIYKGFPLPYIVGGRCSRGHHNIW